MSAAEHLQEQLFDVPKAEKTELSFGPEWDYHASKSHSLPHEQFRGISPELDDREYSGRYPHPLGLHVGTINAALDRSFSRVVHPVLVDRTKIARPKNEESTHSFDGITASEFWDDDSANGGDPASTRAVRAGKVIQYVNNVEDQDSISIRAPRERLQSWAEHVVQNPSDHSHAERRAVRNGWNPVYLPPEASVHDIPGVKNSGPRGVKIAKMDVEQPDGEEQALRGAWTRPYQKPSRKSPPQEETLF